MRHTAKNISLRPAMIFFFVLTFFHAQAAEKAELTINIKDCRDIQELVYLPELQILKNGKEFKTIRPQSENIQVFKNLELGTYTLVYKSLFNKKESLKVEITENRKYSITLCTDFIDYSKETYKPIIDQLKENEAYIIYFSSQGCFHSAKDTATIKRDNNIYTIIWGTKFKKLSSKDIESLRNFEIQLNYMTRSGCTTTDTYVIHYKGKAKQINDGSCNWDGKYYLKKKIFGEE